MKQRRRRIVLLVLVGITAGFGALRTFWFPGLVFPIRVTSGSMAPALYGPHFQWTCDDCGFSFNSDARTLPTGYHFVCPNCGFTKTSDAGNSSRPGQRVFLERPTRLQRYDVIVTHRSDDPSRHMVKRIVGLPGETMRIENGDLFCGDRRLSKSADEFAEVAITVHDDRFRPQSTPTSRWRPTSPGTHWRQSSRGHEWRGGPEALGDDWLVYHHSAALPPPNQRGLPAVLWDNCPYNQGTSRVLQRVTDYAVELVGAWSGTGRIHVQRRGERQVWTATWDTAAGQVFLTRDEAGQHLTILGPLVIGPGRPQGSSPRLTCGFWDGEFHFLIDDVEQFVFACDGQFDLRSSMTPLAIAVDGFHDFRLTDLKITRDIFYTDAYGTNQTWSLGRALGPNEFLTLGDNSPVSRDARHAELLGVFARSQIEARVIPRGTAVVEH